MSQLRSSIGTFGRNLFILSVITLVVYYGLWFLTDKDQFFYEEYFIPNILFCIIFNAVALGINAILTHFYRIRRFSYLRIAVHTLLVLVTNLFAAMLLNEIFYSIWEMPEDLVYWKDGLVFSITASCISMIYVAGHYNRLLMEQIKMTHRAELSLLKRQLDPHFMFNSLNTLIELIDENPQLAEDFTIKLSNIYRYILAHFNDDYISIREAVCFTRSYGELLKIRYPDSFIIRISEELERCDDRIIPLSLQMLTENAIKHNRHNVSTPLTITYSRNDDFLIVRNNQNPLDDRQNTSVGIGLDNLNRRYLIQCERPIEVGTKDGYFEVKLPIIPNS